MVCYNNERRYLLSKERITNNATDHLLVAYDLLIPKFHVHKLLSPTKMSPSLHAHTEKNDKIEQCFTTLNTHGAVPF